MAKQDAGLVKRQQIAKASRMMFVWIVAASVVVGAAGVSSLFMVRKASFNNKILGVQNKTIQTLQDNNKAVDALRENVRVLNTDPALASAKSFSDEQTIRVILDALPDEENIPALGASIQKELVDVPGVDLDSLSFASVGGGAVDDESADGSDTAAPVIPVDGGATPIVFSMKLVADKSGGTSPMTKLNKVLKNLESSIRAINITNSKLEISDASATLTISAVAYYQPGVSLELKDVQVTP